MKATIGGFAVAALVGVVWGFFPSWQFYLTLALGFGVAETVAKFGGNKRGLDLQLAGWGAVLLGLVVSRVVLSQRLDLSWEQISDLSPFVEAVMYLELIPDGLFALIPFVIVFIRFK